MSRTFTRKRHRQSLLTLWYQAKLRRSPFLFFGLPFLSIIVLGSYALSSFTTIRYERHDQKVKIATEEDLLKLEKDLDNWEQKRVTRLQGTALTSADCANGQGSLKTSWSRTTNSMGDEVRI